MKYFGQMNNKNNMVPTPLCGLTPNIAFTLLHSQPIWWHCETTYSSLLTLSISLPFCVPKAQVTNKTTDNTGKGYPDLFVRACPLLLRYTL